MTDTNIENIENKIELWLSNDLNLAIETAVQIDSCDKSDSATAAAIASALATNQDAVKDILETVIANIDIKNILFPVDVINGKYKK